MGVIHFNSITKFAHLKQGGFRIADRLVNLSSNSATNSTIKEYSTVSARATFVLIY